MNIKLYRFCFNDIEMDINDIKYMFDALKENTILKYIEIVENTHKQPQEIEIIQKIKIMVNKK